MSVAAPGSPAAILARSVAALRTADGFAMHGALLRDGHVARLRVTVSRSGGFAMHLALGAAREDVIAADGMGYVRANAAYWRVARAPAALAGHWIRVPPTRAQAFSASLGALAPATLARCLAEDHGTLSLAGRTRVGGRAAVVLRDSGNVPGGAPGLLAVAAGGTPYPLRATITGDQRPGGRIDVCNDGRGDQTRGTIVFGAFNDAPRVRAPAHAIDVNGLSA